MVSETMALRGTGGTARMMGLLCVADSKLGEFGEGQRPVTRTGDYSDVVVVDADGRIIPWQRVARLDRTEMDRTMREIVDRLYTFLRNMEAAELAMLRDHREDETSQWRQTQRKSRSEEAARGSRKRHRRQRTEAGNDRRATGSGLRRRAGPAGARSGNKRQRGG